MGWSDGSMVDCASYLSEAMIPSRRKVTLSRVFRHLNQIRDKFDAIAVCGLSGLLIGTTIADRLGKSLIVVRKKDDRNTHSSCKVEGSLEGRYIILDDTLCSGNTIRHIISSISEIHNRHAVCIGVYLWLDHVHRHDWFKYQNGNDDSGFPKVFKTATFTRDKIWLKHIEE